MKLNKNIIVMIIFVAIYMISSLIYAWNIDNFEFLLYLFITLLIMFGVIYAHKKIGFTDTTLWLLAVWGFMHMAGGLVAVPASWPIEGDVRVLYSWWIIPNTLKYDNLVHAFGFGTTTWCCWQGLKTAAKTRKMRPSFGRLTLVVMAAMGFSALNEILEFIAVLTVPNTNVGGYMNTCWDLVYNMVGCLIAAIIIKMNHQATH